MASNRGSVGTHGSAIPEAGRPRYRQDDGRSERQILLHLGSLAPRQREVRLQLFVDTK